VVTLTATITAGSTPVTRGLVNFCDATATYCEDIHILGAAQLTSAGTAVFKFRPGIGSHSYKAVFAGTKVDAGSSSSASSLAVTGLVPTTTTIAQSGGPTVYTLTSTVAGAASTAPTGTVSFLNTSTGNSVIATAALASQGLGFLNPSNPASGAGSYVLAVADFNGDGIPDLVVGNNYGGDSGTVTILLGNGDGAFTAAPATLTTIPPPISLVVADFNGDGIPDLAVLLQSPDSAASTVMVFLGNGDGTFTTVETSPMTGNGADAIAAADFNQDGIPDLAITNYQSGTLTILLGNGDGTFTAAASPSAGTRPSGITIADFNGDGIPDLAVLDDGFGTETPESITVFLGNGDGTFTLKSSTTVSEAGVPVVADFNGDSIPDMAIPNYSGGSPVIVLLGNGDGTFTAAPIPAATGPYPNAIAVGDFNGDGIADLASAAGEPPYAIYLLMGNGNGTFTTATASFTGDYDLIEAANFTASGFSGLVAASSGGRQVTVLTVEQTAIAIAENVTLSVESGSDLVEASYPGDSTYSPSVSATTALTPPVQPTTLALTSSVAHGATGQVVTLTATLSPYTYDGHSSDTEEVTFKAYNPTNSSTLTLGNGTLSGGVATLTTTSLPVDVTPPGIAISAYYGGDSFLEGSTSTLSIIVNAGQPDLALTVNPTSSTAGQPVTLTATLSAFDPVTANGQNVTFSGNGHILGTGTISSGVAALTTSSLALGVDLLTAIYPGDVNNAAAMSNTAFESVTLSGQTATNVALAVTSSGAAVTSVASGTPVTLTATVTAGGTPVSPGTVIFCDTSLNEPCTSMAQVGNAQLTSVGTAAITVRLGIGLHPLVAIFKGSAGAVAGISSFSSLSVTGLSRTIGTITATLNAPNPGGYSVQDLVQGIGPIGTPSPTGTVQFLDQTFSNAVLATAPLSTGPFTKYGPNLNYNPGTFQPLSGPTTGSTPFSVAEQDFNHDGIPDLAVANSGGNTVSILLGNGDGTYQAQTAYPAGNGPIAVAVGDFNGDGNPDLAVANFSDNTVSILLGNSNGTFQTQHTFATGGAPNAVFVADFNGDGILDLAVANSTDGTVSVLLGKGDGTFETQQTYATGNAPESIVVGDFNGDGIPDLAVANNKDNTVSVLLGVGDGTFHTQVPYATGKNPISVTMADFLGNGILDLAVANLADNTVSILNGNGDGTFQAQTTQATGTAPYAIVAGNLSGLGYVDLATADSGSNTVTLLANQGGGVFKKMTILCQDGTPQTSSCQTNSPTALSQVDSPIALAVADFNSDGMADLAVLNNAGNSVSVLLNTSGTESQSAATTVNFPSANTVVGAYGGDSIFAEGNSTPIILTLPALTDSVALALSANPTSYGSPLVLTATLTAQTSPLTNSNGTTVGFVMNYYTNLGTGTIESGVATVTTSSLPVGTNQLEAVFEGNDFYGAADSSLVSVTVRPAAASVAVTPASSSIGTPQALSVSIAVTGVAGALAPTGTVTLSSGSYSSTATTLQSGSATIGIPAGSLPAGSDTLTANYSGDSNYAPGSAKAPITVTNPSYAIAGQAVSVAPGATTGNTSAVTITPASGFTGSVALTSAVTSSPSGAQSLPTLSFDATTPVSITGAAAGNATLTIATTAASSPCSASLASPNRAPWYAGGSAVLACLLLFGVPARRRSWRTMLGMVFLLASFAIGILACGGSASKACTALSNPGTTAGTYTITVTGTSGSLTETGTVTLTVQ
jgi:hypothetical protein